MDRKRRVKERAAGAARGPVTECERNVGDQSREVLLELLDGELNALPEKYRSPIILCDLEGLSYREAATRLKCLQGTLSGRLARGRAMLARRLARHGVPVSAAALVALLAREATAAVPRSLITWTNRAGSLFAVGKALSEDVVSSKVASLSEGVLKMLLLSKLKSLGGGLLFLAAVVVASWSWAATVSAGASEQAPRTEETSRATTDRKSNVDIAPGEAEFVFRGASKGGKSVSLIVAGTTGPILCLPVQEDIQVVVGGRQVQLDDLEVGTKVAIRLDGKNRVIQDIRTLQRPEKATILKNAKELNDLQSPPLDEVLRGLPRVPRGIPGVLEVFRDDIQVVSERLVRQVDPPRVFPLVGEAELHHNHWKCTVYYTDTVESGYPFPVRSRRPRAEVIYIDKDFLVPTK